MGFDGSFKDPYDSDLAKLRSGDDEILRRMDRGYTNERYRCG